MFFSTTFFWYIDGMFSFIFITKNTNADRNLTENFMSLKSSFLAKSLSAFVILLGLWGLYFEILIV